MSPARQLEKALFDQLLDIAEPAGREAFLDRCCRDDPALRSRLLRLLSYRERADAFLNIPAPAPSITSSSAGPLASTPAGGPPTSGQARPPLDPQAIIGRYKLGARLGEGGCGVVYLAEQQEPVRRQVALKIIRLGMDTESVIARFEMERQALALMDHPNIARVLDAGATEAGRPYFVMELVRGTKITDYCDQNRVDTNRRLDLFAQICHAIQHAHQKGIVHRDIKPSNILVTLHDGVPVPKVIDFGVAKAIEGRLGDAPVLTANFHLVGTPAYMSPEQTDLGNPDLDTRSDIYSLGVLLHELLTGRTPFDSRELAAGGLDEMRRIIREREAPRPSEVLAALPPAELGAIADRHHADPARLLAAVRGDLDWIVATALEKDRSRRYETAYGLAMDIRRHLANELVAARPPSRLYRLGKLVRRNRGVFLAGLLILITLLAGLGTSTWLLLREQEARREQARLRDAAEHAQANEVVLREQAEAGEKIARAAVSLSYGEIQAADALVASVPDALLRPSLECAQVLRELGEWHALAGRWGDSARCHFALATVITQVDGADSDNVSFRLLPAAAAIRENGEPGHYEAFRRTALERFSATTNPMVAEQVVKAGLLAPADRETLLALTPLAELVAATLRERDPLLSANPYLDAWRCFALALHSLRRGDPEDTLHWGERSLSYANVNTPRRISVELLMAMAHAHQDEAGEAALAVARNRVLIEARFQTPLVQGDTTLGFWFDWINARILLREASALLEQPLRGLGPAPREQ